MLNIGLIKNWSVLLLQECIYLAASYLPAMNHVDIAFLSLTHEEVFLLSNLS